MAAGQEARRAQVIALSEARQRSDAQRAREELARSGKPRCTVTTSNGRQCRNYAGASGRCRIHDPVEDERRDPPADAGRPTASPADLLRDAEVRDALVGALAFLRRRLVGDYDVDLFGFDQELTEKVLAPLLRPLYRTYWRVSAVGLEHVPDVGPALLVSNHAGVLPFDALMTKLALLDEHPAGRHLRELAADLAFRLPVVGPLARKSGNTLAHDDDAIRLLAAGELVGVWPEGFKGVGKHYRDRYKLQRFGRGGFAQLALRMRAPIIPVATIGSEEIYPMVGDIKLLARLLGFPYFPVTWQFPALGPLGLLPLPTKWLIEFGPPIDTAASADAADDPMAVLELTEHVRDTIQQMLYRNLLGRRSIFF